MLVTWVSRSRGLLPVLTMQQCLLKNGQAVDVDFYHVFTPYKKADARYQGHTPQWSVPLVCGLLPPLLHDDLSPLFDKDALLLLPLAVYLPAVEVVERRCRRG